MAWEIIERHEDWALWQGRDAEGRAIYATTGMSEGGIYWEPTGNIAFYTKKAAKENCFDEGRKAGADR